MVAARLAEVALDVEHVADALECLDRSRLAGRRAELAPDRLIQTRRYCRSSRYSGPQTLVSNSVCSTTLPACAARCWSRSHSVRDSDTSSPPLVSSRRSRSISMSSKATMPAPGETPTGPAQHGAYARGQFVGVERLGDVVVGAEVEPLRLVAGRALGRQQDDRHRPPLAQLAHDLDAVEVGHDDVQQDDVGPNFLGLLECLFAAAGSHDAEALVVQGQGDKLGDAWLVVGDEYERLTIQKQTSWNLIVRPALHAPACNGDFSDMTDRGCHDERDRERRNERAL